MKVKISILFFVVPALAIQAQSPKGTENSNDAAMPSVGLNFICCATILSETVATQPMNKDRKNIGVGEEVVLSLDNGESAEWTIMSGGGILSSGSGIEVSYYAPGVASMTTIKAETQGGCTATVIFQTFAPSAVKFGCPVELACLHRPLYPSGGMRPQLFLAPSDIFPGEISFYNVDIKELFVSNTEYMREGYWADVNIGSHAEGEWVSAMDEVSQDMGTKIDAIDNVIFIGNIYAPTGQGKLELAIPVRYRIKNTLDEFDVPEKSIQGIDSYFEDGEYRDNVFKGGLAEGLEAGYLREDNYFENTIPPPFFVCQYNEYFCD